VATDGRLGEAAAKRRARAGLVITAACLSALGGLGACRPLPFQAPSAEASRPPAARGRSPSASALRPREARLVAIPTGVVQIGDDAAPADERPAFRYRASPLDMDRTPVTVAKR